MNKLNKTILSNENGRKSASGITLIALVITIIVLLILAGVTIAAITGSENAMEKAQDARTKNDEGAMKDAASLLATNYIQEYYNKVYVENDNDFKEDYNNAGEYAIEQFDGLTEGGFTYAILDTNKLSVSDSKGNSVTGTILDNGNISWGDESSSGGTTPSNPTEPETPQPPAEPLEIGDTISYSTTLNNQSSPLNNWKVFYVDGEYTYIILDGYLPNVYISSSIKTTNSLDTNETYSIYSDSSREDLINAMTNTSNWADLINNGKINGTDLSDTIKLDTTNVFAMGAPTVDLWVNSWNAKYTSDILYTEYSADAFDNGYDGWFISDSPNPTTTDIDLSSKTGYNNTLYFPHQEDIDNDNCYGYWLASPSANDGGDMMTVNFHGYVYINNFGDGVFAFRPVIKLPTSVVNQ